MQIGVAYSEPSQQVWLTIEVPDESTALQAIEASGLLKQFPPLDLKAQKIGVFGKLVKPDTPLKPGDRVEIYRGIICDPQSVPRRQMDEDDDD